MDSASTIPGTLPIYFNPEIELSQVSLDEG